MNTFLCALSGEESDPETLVLNDDPLGEFPEGWSRITIERRQPNPRFVEIQSVKRALVSAALSQMPEEAQGQMYPLVAMQIDAQFAALEELTPEYMIVREVVHVGDFANSRVLATEYSNLRETLGLDRVDVEDDEDDDNDKEDE